MSKIYVGAPIDTAGGKDPAETFKLLSMAIFDGLGKQCVIYNPFLAFLNVSSESQERDLSMIASVNEVALASANVGVFEWNGAPSFGVPLEINWCVENDVACYVYNSTGKPLGAYLRHLAYEEKLTIVTSLNDLSNVLREKHYVPEPPPVGGS